MIREVKSARRAMLSTVSMTSISPVLGHLLVSPACHSPTVHSAGHRCGPRGTFALNMNSPYFCLKMEPIRPL